MLNPVSSRSQQDFYRLLRIADGDDSQRSELEHPYSAVELDEICRVLRHLRRVQQILLRVNECYIESASMSDEDRVEPAFKLQGSYRNMAKLAEKVVAVMNDDELEQLLLDHYEQESQTLTDAAEANLLKFYQLTGHMTEERAQRWQHICAGFNRRQALGDEDDPIQVAVRQLVSLNERLGEVGGAIAGALTAADARDHEAQLAAASASAAELAGRIGPALDRIADREQPRDPKVEVINTLPRYYAQLYQQHIEVIEQSLTPTMQALGKHLDSNEQIRGNLRDLVEYLRRLIAKSGSAERLDLNDEEERGEL